MKKKFKKKHFFIILCTLILFFIGLFVYRYHQSQKTDYYKVDNPDFQYGDTYVFTA